MTVESLPSPLYANVIGVRTTPVELILQFGCIFGAPSQPVVGPENITPSVCLVLPVSSLRHLSEVLTKAADEHEKAMRAGATASFAVKEAKIAHVGI